MVSNNVGIEKVCIANKALRGNLALLLLLCFSLATSFFFMGAYVYSNSQSQLIPYIVTVDSHGIVVSSDIVDSKFQVPRQALIATLGDFVQCLRQISTDKQMQKQSIYKVYSHVKDKNLADKLDSIYRQDNPFELMQKGFKQITIDSIILNSNNSATVTFIEQSNFDGQESIKHMQANLIFEINQVSKDKQIIKNNPLGIYVKALVINESLDNVK